MTQRRCPNQTVDGLACDGTPGHRKAHYNLAAIDAAHKAAPTHALRRDWQPDGGPHLMWCGETKVMRCTHYPQWVTCVDCLATMQPMGEETREEIKGLRREVR